VTNILPDNKAIDSMLDRTFGKPLQTVEVENKIPISDEEMFVVLFNRILAKGQLKAEEIVFGLKRQERFKNLDEAKLLNA
jgi:hypothetical protein